MSKSEINHLMRESDAMNRAVMPKWRETLERVFSGDIKATEDEKAVLLGIPAPGRRQFFKVGGATLAGAAIIAACGSDDSEGSGTTTTVAGAPAGDPSMDLTLAKTAASIEKLAVDVYGNPAVGTIVTNPDVLAAAGLFASHHQEHLDALNGVITGAGEAAIDAPNQAIFDALVTPVITKEGVGEADVLALAFDLENAAMVTYAYAGGVLSTPGLRSTIMTIGGVEARHAAILRFVIDGGVTGIFKESGFVDAKLDLPEGAVIS